MIRARGFWSMCVALLCAAPMAHAGYRNGLDVELWTDRGQDAVYRPGEPLEVRVRTSDDAYLLVYEIDAEGRVRLIAPEWGARGYVSGGETFQVPSPSSDMELVVEGPVGEGYLVAIASRTPFRPLPWYLRPYNEQAEDIGYAGGPSEDEEGVTAEGRIVGDPFVAMERIRRSVLDDPEDEGSFATAYTSYYVHHAVRYPRYLCYDCHRPNQWAWWDGFDPYYTTCSVMDFRVNWAWGWGPSYWYGYVPYYYYVYRADCPPRYRLFTTRDACFSSWDGRKRWRSLWGSNLVRYKSAPPPGYVAPNKFDERTRGYRQPPGFLAGGRNSDTGRRAGLVPTSREKNNDRWWRGDRPSTSLDSRRGAGRDGRAGLGLGRRDDSSSKDEGRGLQREKRAFDLPRQRPDAGTWGGRRQRNDDPPSESRREPGFGRSSQDRPRFEPPRERSREQSEGWRQRSQPRFEQPRGEPSRGWSDRAHERSQPRFESPRGWQDRSGSRERSQPRFEAPRGRSESRERPQPRVEQPRDRGNEGGRAKEESGGSGWGHKGRK